VQIRQVRYGERLDKIEARLETIWNELVNRQQQPYKIQSPHDQLYDLMDKSLNDEEVQDLCFTLKIDWESLPAQSKRGRIREVIRQMQRESRIYQLIDYLQRKRPQIEWPSL
jgi:HD superfamily phosphodiesterase